MDAWQKESLGLEIGDTILWQGEAIQVEGDPPLVSPGMKGKVAPCTMAFTWIWSKGIRSLSLIMDSGF